MPEMTMLDALTADGRSALIDLDGVSPGGGFVTSEPAHGPQITPGDVVRYGGALMAVTEAAHNAVYDLTWLAMIDAHGSPARHMLAAPEVIERRTDVRIIPGSLYKLADSSAAARYVSTAPGAADGRVDDSQLAAWIQEEHGASLDASTITGLHDLKRLASLAVHVLDEHRATHPVRDIAVWTLDGGTGEALITVDHPSGIRQASFTIRPAAFEGHTHKEALAQLLAIARALTGRLDGLVASAAHLLDDAARAAEPAAPAYSETRA